MEERSILRLQVYEAIQILKLRDPDWISLVETAIEATTDEEFPPKLVLVWNAPG